jgi:hypothetical protein
MLWTLILTALTGMSPRLTWFCARPTSICVHWHNCGWVGHTSKWSWVADGGPLSLGNNACAVLVVGRTAPLLGGNSPFNALVCLRMHQALLKTCGTLC